MNTTQRIPNPYSGNYKISLKEVKDLNKWKIILCSRLNMVHMTTS